MCKETVRIGRKLDAQATTAVIGGASTGLALPRDPARVGVVLALSGTSWANATDVVRLEANIGGTFFPFLSIAAGFASNMADVDKFGQLITSDLRVNNPNLGGYTVTLIALRLDEALEKA